MALRPKVGDLWNSTPPPNKIDVKFCIHGEALTLGNLSL